MKYSCLDFSGSFAVNTSSYSNAGSKPPFKQIFEESAVPGKPDFVQSAKAQALLGMGIAGAVGDALLVSEAFAVSRVRGRWYVSAT